MDTHFLADSASVSVHDDSNLRARLLITTTKSQMLFCTPESTRHACQKSQMNMTSFNVAELSRKQAESWRATLWNWVSQSFSKRE